LPLVTEVLRGLLKVKASAEVLRAIALYVTYALHQDDDNLSGRAHWQPRTIPRLSIRSSDNTIKTDLKVDESFVSVRNEKPERSMFSRSMLGFLHSWLCKKDDIINIKRFACAVTSKVSDTR